MSEPANDQSSTEASEEESISEEIQETSPQAVEPDNLAETEQPETQQPELERPEIEQIETNQPIEKPKQMDTVGHMLTTPDQQETRMQHGPAIKPGESQQETGTDNPNPETPLSDEEGGEEASDEDYRPPNPDMKTGSTTSSTQARAQRVRRSTAKGIEYNLPRKQKTFNQSCDALEDSITAAYKEIAKEQSNSLKLHQHKKELSQSRTNLQADLTSILMIADDEEAKARYEHMNYEIQEIVSLLVTAMRKLEAEPPRPDTSTVGLHQPYAKTTDSVISQTKSVDRSLHLGARPKQYITTNSIVGGQSNASGIRARDSVSNSGKCSSIASHHSDKAGILLEALTSAAAFSVKKQTIDVDETLKAELDRLKHEDEEDEIVEQKEEEERRLTREQDEVQRALQTELGTKEKLQGQAKLEEEKQNTEAEIERNQAIALASFQKIQEAFKTQSEEDEKAREQQRIQREEVEKAREQQRAEEEKAREQQRIQREEVEKAREQQRAEEEKAREQQRAEEEKAREQQRVETERVRVEQEDRMKQKQKEQIADIEQQKQDLLAQMSEDQRVLRSKLRLKEVKMHDEQLESKRLELEANLQRKAQRLREENEANQRRARERQKRRAHIALKARELESFQIDADLAIQTAVIQAAQSVDEFGNSPLIPQHDLTSFMKAPLNLPDLDSFLRIPHKAMPSSVVPPVAKTTAASNPSEQENAKKDPRWTINVSSRPPPESQEIDDEIEALAKRYQTSVPERLENAGNASAAWNGTSTKWHQAERDTLWYPPGNLENVAEKRVPSQISENTQPIELHQLASHSTVGAARKIEDGPTPSSSMIITPTHTATPRQDVTPQVEVPVLTFQGRNYLLQDTLSPHAQEFMPTQASFKTPPRLADKKDSSTERGGTRRVEADVIYNDNTQNPPRNNNDQDSSAQSLADIFLMSRMPLQEPCIFKGNPIEYPEWKASFQLLIERQRIPDTEKLLYLKRYLDGTARDCIQGFLLINNSDAYQRALKQLEERFGNPFIVSQAFRTKLDAWNAIKGKDATALRDFSDFLQQCLVAITKVGGLEILNDALYQKGLAEKLPEWMQNRWIREVAKTKMQRQRYPTFEEFATFIAVEASVSNDPLYRKTVIPTTIPAMKQTTYAHKEPLKRTTMATATDDKTPTCVYCGRKGHELPSCLSFRKMPYKERREYILNSRLCFKCLKSKYHIALQCKEVPKCNVCRRPHQTCLHDNNYDYTSQSRGQSSSTPSRTYTASPAPTNNQIPIVHQSSAEDPTSVTSRQTNSKSQENLTSMIVPVYLSSSEQPNEEILVYALLDTASDSTFVTSSVAGRLDAKPENVTLRINTISDVNKDTKTQKFKTLRVRGVNSGEYITLPETYAIDKLSTDISHIPTNETASKCPHLKHLEDSFQPFHQDCPIGLLIGYDCPAALMPLNRVGEKPYAIETKLGWSIVGPTPTSPSFDSVGASYQVVSETMQTSAEKIAHTNKINVEEATATDIMHVLERDFVETEEGTMSQDDIKFLKIVRETIQINGEGHYQMPLPFRTETPLLSDNRDSVRKRTIGLANQFKRHPKKHEDYKKFMDEILKRGDAELVPESEIDQEKRWYIPHHGVYHPKKPNKIRVVFDCSATHQGTCLNDLLLQGPDLINSLNGVLCRFRKGPIAYCCDVEKMYHQFHVTEEHRDYLRFLWWENGDTTKPLRDYRMKVHIFGAKSSPGCANFGLKQIAKDNAHIHQESADFLQRDFYVDDGLKASETVTEAVTTLQKAREICEKGKLRLHKITSNSDELKSNFPPSEVTDRRTTELSANDSTEKVERTLGLQWNTTTDTLSFNCEIKETPETRRGVLSTIASLYDPLGLLSPFILKGKQVLQEVCCENAEWDAPLPELLAEKWKTWRTDLTNVENVQIARNLQPVSFTANSEVEFHHFSDASTTGYGQCSYAKYTGPDKQTHCALIMAKSRVVPKKGVTIPRLELQAAVLSVKVARFLQEELDYQSIKHVFWTDSQIVLAYIRNESKRFHIFVANRIYKILKFSDSQQWNYVPTAHNPADLASRGASVEDLMSSEWYVGPAFLREHCPSFEETSYSIPSDDKEVKHCKATTTKEMAPSNFETRIRKFSSKESLIRAFSVIVRKCEHKQGREHSKLELNKLTESRLIRCVQQEAFTDCSTSTRKKLRTLDAKKDSNGILRVSGRLGNSLETPEIKNPIILPKHSHFSVLVADFSHRKVGHQRRTTTMSNIRQRGYWIISMRKTVRHVIKECIPCRKRIDSREEQKMADLPRTRVEEAAPFTHCGLDCFGPFHVKDGRKEVKRYGLIVTCMPTRAIHLEVLDDLSTDAFINGLRNVIAIRGNIRTIQCDRGTNFIGANNEMTSIKNSMTSNDKETVITEMIKQQCEFKFNPPAASHMGGVWERQIRTVRSVLSGLITQHGTRLSTSSLRTLLYEVMAIVNGRPLTVESLECPNGPLPITPNHLLTMKPTVILPPPGDFDEADIVSRSQWRRVQRIADEFWKRWRDEYLFTLQPRRIWQRPRRNIMINDIVILRDINECRAEWKLARVEETFPSKDGLVRSVRIILPNTSLDAAGKASTPSTRLVRPVQKLTVLVPSDDHDYNPTRQTSSPACL